MNQKELVRGVVSAMKDSGIRKPVKSPKQILHISDDEGNSKDFVVKKTDKTVMFTIEDVESIINTCLYVIKEALKKGDSVTIRGFGTLGLHHRKARSTKHPVTGERVEVEARYIPKFVFGNELRWCAKIYELSLDEKGTEQTEPYDEDAYDDEGDS